MGWHHNYDDSEEEEEPSGPPDRGEAKKEPLQTAISNAIDAIHGDKAFSSHGKVEHFVDPELRIDAGGPISLPLNRVDASRILIASHQAPFGKGEQTIVDVNVRRTWELNAADLTIQNPAFEGMVSNVVAIAAHALGVANPQEVKGELYKLLLYEPGAMFKPHVDSEKAPGMFGTLVVCLPALHEGGDVVLTHGYSTAKYSTSSCQPSYLCWYADVRHEVTEVKQGYRLVLTYNLIKPLASSPSDTDEKPMTAAQFPELCDTLQQWLEFEAPEPSATNASRRRDSGYPHYIPDNLHWHSELIYALHHEYTEDSLALNALKAADLDRAQALEIVGRELGFNVLLTTTERFVHTGEGETFADCVELRKVFDLDGSLLLSDIPTREECFLQEDTFEDGRDPDEDDHEGYTGNAGAEDKFWYRNTALMLIKNDDLMRFLTRGFADRENMLIGSRRTNSRESAATLISAWTKKYSAHKSDQVLQTQLRYLCDHVLDSNAGELKSTEQYAANARTYREDIKCYYRQNFSDAVMGSVVKAAVELRDTSMLLQAIRCVKERLPEQAFSAIVEAVGNLSIPLDDIRQALDESLNTYKSFAERYNLLKNILSGGTTPNQCSIRDWAVSALTAKLKQMPHADAEDGAATLGLLAAVQEQPGVEQSMFATIGHLLSSGDFGVALLGSLCGDDCSIAQEKKEIVLSALLPLASLKVRGPEHEIIPRYTTQMIRRGQGLRRGIPRPQPKPASYANGLPVLLAALVQHCARSSPLSTVDLMCFKLKEAAYATASEHFGPAYMPSIRALLPIFPSITDELRGASLSALVVAILERYVSCYVRKQPASNATWARAGVACNCHLCVPLNAFLRSPTQYYAGFPLTKNARQHLHQKLDASSNHCTHTTERGTRPETLMVTKMDFAGLSNDSWKERCEEVAKEFRNLGQDVLRQALGESFDRVFNMWDVVVDFRRAPEGLQRPTLQELQQNAVASTGTSLSAGSKRQAEEGLEGGPRRKPAPTVIDLCDSD